jgi:hypothetical protein
MSTKKACSYDTHLDIPFKAFEVVDAPTPSSTIPTPGTSDLWSRSPTSGRAYS